MLLVLSMVHLGAMVAALLHCEITRRRSMMLSISDTNKDAQYQHTATTLVRGAMMRSDFCETSEAMYLTSGYVYESAEAAEQAFIDQDRFVYSRYGNPTVAMFEERLRLLEGAEACQATASGMAAVYAALAGFLSAGDKVVSSRALFGSCHVILAEILPRFGVESVLVDGCDLAAWEQALQGGAKAVFLESPSNPTLQLVDVAAVSEMAHAAGALVMIDNVFASPILQKPLELGADVVVYSATKHIDGQGRTLGGAILSSDSFYEDYVQPFIRHTGPSLSPFNAWVLVKGLETVKLRVEAQSAAALSLAQRLESHSRVKKVSYPTLDSHPQVTLAKKQMASGGTILTFEVANKSSAFRLMNALSIIDISNNIGDSKSLMTHPATTTHRRLGPEARAEVGISEGLIRLSVGLEDIEELWQDLDQAITA